MTSEPLISVIIPTYGRPEILDECVDAVRTQAYANFEIIVVSDGAPRPVYEDERVQILHEKEPRGSPTAKNDGIAAANGDILIFLDDDAIPGSPDWLRQYADEFAEADETVGGIGGYISESNPFAGSDQVGTITRNRLGFYRVVSNFEADQRQPVDHLKSCNFAVCAGVLDDLDRPYFSPKFTRNAHREETDFSLRIRQQGYTLLYTPRCAVDHRKANTGGQRKVSASAILGGLASAYWSGRNEAVFYRRHFHSGLVSAMIFVLQEALTHRNTPLKQLAKLGGIIRELSD